MNDEGSFNILVEILTIKFCRFDRTKSKVLKFAQHLLGRSITINLPVPSLYIHNCKILPKTQLQKQWPSTIETKIQK